MDFPDPPTPDANFAMLVEFNNSQKELSPSTEDTVEAAVSKKLREAGVIDSVVTISQDTSLGSRNVMGGGRVIEPPELNHLNFNFQEDVLSVTQIQKAQRVIIGTLREYEVPAQEENVLVRAVAPIDLGSL